MTLTGRLTDQLIDHLKAGRPLNEMSARQTFGVHDLRRAIWNIRARGYHLTQQTVMTLNKHTGEPTSVVEYRLRD